jgi:hypothetical protein
MLLGEGAGRGGKKSQAYFSFKTDLANILTVQTNSGILQSWLNWNQD